MATVDAIVIGGGLAGLTAAVRLTQRGIRVVLLEARSVFGGRTSSWKQDGMKVESGLHRYLGFYRAMPKLYRDIGVDINDLVFWEDEMEIRLPGAQHVLGFSSLRKTAKTLRTLFDQKQFLDWKDKLSLVKTVVPGIARAAFAKNTLDQVSLENFARTHGVTPRVMERIITPFSTGLFFLPPRAYSAYAYFAPFIPGLLQPHRIGVAAFRGGMTDVVAAPIVEWLVKHGATVTVRAPVDCLLTDNGTITGVHVNGEDIHARNVVLATTLTSAQKLISHALPNHRWFLPMQSLGTMPCITAQFELRRRALRVDRTTFAPNTRLACFSEQSMTTFRHVPGRLSVILSEPASLMDKSPKQIADLVMQEARRLNFDFADAVTDYRVIYQPADFYDLGPGNNQLRPPQRTPVPGLVLAGDYTQQSMLGSMEGAVISGNLAARAVT